MNRIMRSFGFAALLGLFGTSLSAQAPTASPAPSGPVAALAPGQSVFNASTIFGGLSSGASLPLGAEGEYILRNADELGTGTFGVAARVHTYSWNWSFDGQAEQVRFTPIAVLGTWHIPMASMPRADFYVGLGLGYFHASYSNSIGDKASAGSELYEVADVGMRYAVTNHVLVSTAVSLGSVGEAGLLRLGVAFRP